MKLTLAILFTSLLTHGFTLTNTKKSLGKNKIKIRIASTDCSNAGFSTGRFRDLVEDAVEDYWNQVASADLELEVSGVTNIDIDGLNHEDIFNAGLVPSHSILAGCNDDAFSPGSGTLGAAQMNCDGSCKSVLIINSRADSPMATIDRNEQIATIAHELGHTIGLGHSEYTHNLMYYKIGGKSQQWLGQDDIDGVTYLYPYEEDEAILGGCGIVPPLIGSMGTIKDSGQSETKSFSLTFFLGALLGLGLAYLFKGFSSFPSK